MTTLKAGASTVDGRGHAGTRAPASGDGAQTADSAPTSDGAPTAAGGLGTPPTSGRARSLLVARDRLTPWAYQAPVMISLLVFVYGPLVFTVVLSFLDWDLVSPSRSFVGTDNYERLFTEPEFPRALSRTGLYVLALLPFATIVPMSLAIMLWKRPGRASDTYRSLLFLPVVLAPVATALSWRFVLDPLGGVANSVFGAVGLPEQDWLGDPDTAIWAVSLITASRFVALNILLYGAALAALDRRCFDAARLDGASEWEITRHLVVPQLLGTTVLLSFLCVVFSGQWTFTNIAVLTQGGPENSTDNIYYRLYTYAFTFFDAGTGAAAAIMIVLILLVMFGISSLLRRRGAQS